MGIEPCCRLIHLCSDWGTGRCLLSFLPRVTPKRMILQSHILLESQVYTLLSKETLSEKKGFTFHPLYALHFIPDILELSQSLRMSYWLESEMWSAGERRRGEEEERVSRVRRMNTSLSDAPASHAAWRRNEILHYFLDQYFCFSV